ncbi:ficolin-2-like [Drosophila busckii]|uniref:ficolin-2-like n=1 Tax=Drosophila busckii TaxID=30019 RepID=UPI00083E9E51|nr:ficolin-2-like [Drosophila busckii]
MKCKRYTLLIAFIWALNGVLEASAFSKIAVSSNTSPKRMKSPLHRRYLYNTGRQSWYIDDALINRLKEELRMEEINLQREKPKIAALEETNNNLKNEITKLRAQSATDDSTKLEACSENLRIETKKNQQLQDQLEKIPSEIMRVAEKIGDMAEQNVKASSCLVYIGNPGIYRIHVPGHMPHNVLCFDGKHEGKGWLMIQRQAFGNEDFQRDWNTYRDGFGSFDGDFFLGLHKIHHITHAHRQKLFIYMETFEDKWFAASYDNFRVGSEDSEFRLESLGAFSGFNEIHNDTFRYNEHMKFTTHDRDNGLWEVGNCATEHQSGGFWYKRCSYFNPNGKFSKTKGTSKQGIHWDEWDGLKTIHMLIRPLI